MNLSEALEAALPEIPRTRLSRKNPPRIDPDLIIREDVVDGEPIVAVYQRSTANLLRLKPTQWQLASLFDGVRSYQEIAAAFEAQTGIPLAGDEVRTFAENMDESGFWYKNPQEKNVAMNEKLTAQRSRRASGRAAINVAHIQFSAWDPDRYLTQLEQRIGKFVFSGWFTLFAVVIFLFQAVVFTVKWDVIGPDIPLYFDFTRKNFSDLVEFWLLLLVIGFVHESSHGLTCKHFGGEVHSMGLMFLYLTPAFYVDVTEAWISSGRLQRLATIIAGLWAEMILCGVAMIIWMNTQVGEWLHDFCYKFMLLSGLALLAINLNPLIKLDGYYFLTEWIRIPDLKERSTAFVMGWVQRHVFRLPVEVPVIARQRVLLFALYALASGAYSYLLLLLFVRFGYNVFFHWFAELAIVPAALLAFVIFRSRLRSLQSFASGFYRNKAGDGTLRFTPLRAALAITLFIAFFLPILRDRENAFFVIEPRETHEVHAGLAGKVVAVYVREGDAVHSGQVMGRLQSLNEASASEEAAAQVADSQAQVFTAELQHSGLGEALAAQRAARRTSATAHEESAQLDVITAAAGVVATRDPESLLNRDVTKGETLLRIVDSSQLVARLYIPASDMDHVRVRDPVSLQLPFRFSEIHGRLGTVEGSALSLPQGLLAGNEYKGTLLPTLYTTRMPLGQAGNGIEPGISGRAKIFGRRRSLAGRIVIFLGNILHRHFW
ncbi:MAG: HlyD family efflux transporter periplasmic adaptor subunit [Acidobacteriaceae bacterium]